jgi:hypothetical protein
LTTLVFVITAIVGTQTDGPVRDGVYQCLIRQSWTFEGFVVAELKVCSLDNSAINCTSGLMPMGAADTERCGLLEINLTLRIQGIGVVFFPLSVGE